MRQGISEREMNTTSSRSRSVFPYCALGFAFGCAMTVPFWSAETGRLVSGLRWLATAWEYANAPAQFLVTLLGTGLGEWGAWLLAPIVAIVLQWTALGFLGGIWRLRVLQRRDVKHARGETSAGATPQGR